MSQDLQDIGVDLGDEVLMSSRSWSWLCDLIFGLFSRPSAMGGPANRVQAAFPHLYARESA